MQTGPGNSTPRTPLGSTQHLRLHKSSPARAPAPLTRRGALQPPVIELRAQLAYAALCGVGGRREALCLVIL